MPRFAQARYAGTDMLPAPARGDVRPRIEVVTRILRNERTGALQWRPQAPAAIPVLSDEFGDDYGLIPTAAGPTVVPWVRGSPVDAAGHRPSAGGFYPKSTAEIAAPNPRRSGPTREAVFAAVMKALAEAGLLGRDGRPSSPNAGSPGAGRSGRGAVAGGPSVNGQPSNPPQSGSTAPGQQSAEGGNDKLGIGDAIRDALSGVLQQQAVGYLAQAFETGAAFSWQGLLGGVEGAIEGLGMAALSSVVTGMLGKGPDDTSSMFDWVKATVGPLLAQRIIGAGNLDKYFGYGPDKPAPLRVGDFDNMSNPILAGCPSVLIEGAVAARETDPVRPPGVAIKYGAKNAMIGGAGMFAARMDDTETNVAQFTQCIPTMAVRTQIGGPTTNPDPPIPKELIDMAKKRGLNSDPINKLHWNPDGPKPETDGFVFDPAAGEWRIWEHTTGMSSTLTEFENLSDWGSFYLDKVAGWVEDDAGKWVTEHLALRSLFGGTADPTKNWTLLGGLFDFGSPMFPGAGTGSTWFVPDTLFGFPMHGYFVLHDWAFDPDNPAHGRLGGWWEKVLADETGPFLAGINSSNNPVRWALQVVYSAATTIAGFLRWLDILAQNLDEQAGLPDKYGQLPHIRHRPWNENPYVRA